MFKPTIGLRNRHLQTLFAPLFRKQSVPSVKVERFELNDGDFLESFWYQNQPIDNRPIVTLFHGLAGSFNSPYIQGVMRALEKKGFASVLMHFRGCSGKENLLPRAYHSGDTADAKAWIAHLAKNYPNNPLYAIGYSIGGNVLLKLLGEEGKNTPLKAGVSVSAPMQLDISAKVINQGFAKIYQWHLLKALKITLLQKYDQFEMASHLNIDKKAVKKIKTIKEFDEKYTAPINGFASAQEYYNRSSAKQYLKDIKIPTLIIHALDDPFMNHKILPTKEDNVSNSVELEVYEHGGHVGFVGGGLFKPEYWLEERIANYFVDR